MSSDSNVLIGGGDELAYRGVSVLSLVGLALGLAAPLCFVAPLLWAVPIAGVIVTLTALVRIDASGGALVGRQAALVGLALSAASISAAAGRSVVTEQLLSRQARKVALQWIEFLQAGDGDQAYHFTAESTRRAPPSTPPIGAPDSQPAPGSTHDGQPSDTDDRLAQFREHPVVRFLMTDGSKMDAKYERDLEYGLGTRGDARIQQEFAVRGATSAPSTGDRLLQITLVRSRTSDPTPSQWYVSEYVSDDLPSSAAATVP